MRALSLALLLVVLPATSVGATDVAAQPSFFGTYCGEADLAYSVTPTFLGIEGRTRTETERAQFTARIDLAPGSGGGRLLYGRGVAETAETTVHFSLAARVLSPGVARGVAWAAGLGSGHGTLRLLADGETLEVTGLGQTIRLSKACDNARPVVDILSPVDGASFPWGRQVSLTARVTDEEDSAFPQTRLVWSSDRDGVLGHGYTFRSGLLSQGVHRLRVTATDSGGRVGVAEVSILVRNNPPEAPTILSPEDGRSYPSSTVVLRGRAGDREDGRLAGEALTWSSDRDGILGTGEHLPASLSVGHHRITLTATDPGAAATSSSVEIDIGSCAGSCPPTVLIRSPEDFVAIDDTSCITLVAEASDDEDGRLGDGDFTWSTTYFDGAAPVHRVLAGRGSSIEVCDLPTGGTDTVHTISVVASDSDGQTSVADTVRIYVIFGGLI